MSSSKPARSRHRFQRRRRPSGPRTVRPEGAARAAAAQLPLCERCAKPTGWLCICDGIRPEKTRLRVLILQHPQEPDKLLGTAQLLALHLENARLKVGLSWPNLGKAWTLGGSAPGELDAKRWAVLYLGGTGAESEPKKKTPPPAAPRLTFVDKKGVPLQPEDQASIRESLQGIVVLDGTWSQAKALWWRNAWLLKLRRCRLDGGPKSLYGELRKEPRRECLSTLEAAGRSLTALGTSSALQERLEASFTQLLNAYRKGPPKTETPEGEESQVSSRQASFHEEEE